MGLMEVDVQTDCCAIKKFSDIPYFFTSPPSVAAFELWAEPSDPGIPPHSPSDSWKTNLEIYGLFWSSRSAPADLGRLLEPPWTT